MSEDEKKEKEDLKLNLEIEKLTEEIQLAYAQKILARWGSIAILASAIGFVLNYLRPYIFGGAL